MNGISVVIPTCDRPDTLIEAVKCVLDQSQPASEIIVVNNGGRVLDSEIFPQPVKVYELPPYVGVSKARNHGVSLALGEYIAFLDDDDLWELDYLRKIAKVIENQHPDCIITRMDRMVDGLIYPYKNAEGKLDLATLLVENPGVGGQTTIVRREAFIQVCGYDPKQRTGEDKALIIDLLIHGFCILSASHIQAILREHSESRLGDAVSMCEGISGFLEKYGRLMSPSQRNYNLLKLSYYRFLYERDPLDYCLFWLRYLLHSFYRRVDSTLPEASRLSILNP